MNLNIVNFFEKIFVILALQLYSGGIIYVILSGGVSQGEDSQVPVDLTIVRQILLVVYSITFILLILRWKKTIYLISKEKFISTLVILAILSILWSSNPTRTLNGCVALIGTTAFGVYLATRYSLKQQLQLLGWTFGIAVVLSLFFVIALPKYGIMSGVHSGAWRGIYTHKNSLGKVMVISASVFLLLATEAQKYRFILWNSFGFSAMLVLLSTSKTSLLNLLIMMATFILCQIFRFQIKIIIVIILNLILIGTCLSIAIISNANFLVGLLGKDLTFTGRIPLWSAVLDLIARNPWLGYGYNALWDNWNSESAYIWWTISWQAPNAHNGFLDLPLALGLLGFSIFILGLIFNLLKSIIQIRYNKTTESFWAIMFMSYFILANLAETSLMQPNNIFWILFVQVVFSLVRTNKIAHKII